MSQLSANQIIDTALTRIGNDTIRTDAQTELQLILNRLYEDYKWPFLNVTISGSISSDRINLPDDFIEPWDKYSFRMVDAAGNVQRTKMVDNQAFELQDLLPTTGTPINVWLDRENNQLVLDVIPTVPLTYILNYRKLPAQIIDFDDPVVFPNDALLVQLVFVWACQHEDDDRYASEYALAQKMIGTYLKRFNISPSKNSRIAYNPSVFGSMNPFR